MSTPPLDIEKLSIHENNSPTNLSFIENSDHNGIVGAKPVIIDNKLSISKYGDNINVFLAPLTNHHYKYNIRNKYINYINNDTSIIENKNDNFSIHKPTLQESIDFSSIDTSNCKIIGLLSSWIDLGTKDALINKISFNIISNEILIAHYNHITNVVISPPKNVNNISNYCEILIKLLKFIKQNNLNITISISLPIITTDDLDYLSTWELWLKIKTLCNNDPNLNISLALLQSYSSANLDFLNKWVFEPVGSLLLSSSIFLPNKFKQPVLNKLNQLIVKKFQSQTGNDFKILLHGLEKYPDNEVTYIEYMNYITQKISKQSKQDTSNNNNNNNNNCFTESKNKEILYSELHYHIEQAFQTTLKTLLKLNKDAIHILVVKPDFDGSIIKTILKNILEMNKNNKDTNIIITVMEDNFINFNKITYLNKNKWGNILNLVDSLEEICQAYDT
ncbi:PRMT5-domain-containing protein [Hanseniaspora valbyensis NRRL Y-1626]|uniref:PRMT5-domain-containing protein n=1 Tax=Hanseniaspora valbyensis NRRL Y-1626 TaxID=766949 RepID=A0A1B7TAX4_9ASCO|nr:PRMT5-domain-containing protein [Hanseniaspora valbyensis NRRL Y-1626]